MVKFARIRPVTHSVSIFMLIAFLFVSACHSDEKMPAGMPALPVAAPSLEQCNVVWDTPSGDSSGSMPIGNGPP